MIDVFGRQCMSLAEVQVALQELATQHPQRASGPIWVRGAGPLFLPVKNVLVLPHADRLETFLEVHQ